MNISVITSLKSITDVNISRTGNGDRRHNNYMGFMAKSDHLAVLNIYAEDHGYTIK